VRTVPLTNSKDLCLVDDSQYRKAVKLKWLKTNGGHAMCTKSPQITLHVFLFGKAPKHLEWEHKNRNGLDNQEHNLRLATHSQNQQNKGIYKNNTSGYTGVVFHRQTNSWHAEVHARSERISLGYWKTPEEAARKRDEAAFFYHGSFARLNFKIKRFPRLPREASRK
jgi:hypothetical protein